MWQWLWPSVDDFDGAKKAVGLGSGAAFFVAGATTLIVVLQEAKVIEKFMDIDQWAFLDAGLFFLIGLGIAVFKSRLAAYAGLLLYLAESGFTLVQTHRFSVQMIFITCWFMSGVRGTSVYRDLKAQADQETEKAAQPQSIFGRQNPADAAGGSSNQPQGRRGQGLKILVLFAILAAGAGYFLWSGGHIQRLMGQFQNAPSEVSREIEWADGASEPMSSSRSDKAVKETVVPISKPSGPSKTFKLKDGSSISGKIVMDDPDYYTLEVSGGKQDIVIKSDIESVS